MARAEEHAVGAAVAGYHVERVGEASKLTFHLRESDPRAQLPPRMDATETSVPWSLVRPLLCRTAAFAAETTEALVARLARRLELQPDDLESLDALGPVSVVVFSPPVEAGLRVELFWDEQEAAVFHEKLIERRCFCYRQELVFDLSLSAEARSRRANHGTKLQLSCGR